jgi:NAD(P)-dependent dehydrogenase (short-subunit alcohol dehydrogenase family)
MKSIIITGSNRGLGQAVAKESSKRGYFYYPICRWNDIDVTDYEALNNFYKEMELPEALVNNAGIYKGGSILEMNVQDWQDVINVNLNGVFNNAKLYAELCIRNKIPGKIINISSTAGLGARPGRAAYAASKAAVINLSLSLSEELKGYGIKVFCLCPGAFDSDMRHQIAPDDNFDNMLKPSFLASFIMDLVEDGKFLDSQVVKLC